MAQRTPSCFVYSQQHQDFYECAIDHSVIKIARPPPSTTVWLTYGRGGNADKVS